ncbi:MAG: diguanylate cyclase [Thermoanaerobaculia bacterium]|nr:diguanylate cyclase [Thermoanaerobaculia bacterium]
METTDGTRQAPRDSVGKNRDAAGIGRILVVDDSTLVRTIVGRILEKEGFDVRTAEDGTDALRLIRAEPFEAVVSDLSMPGLDGFDLLVAIRALEVPPEVVFLSGARADDFTAAVRALRLGAHDFLTKPPREEDLIHSVHRAVQTCRLKGENRLLLLALERETRTDPLTGAGNRRAFAESLHLELSRSRRYGSSLGLAVLDLDHFKRTNDTWGHAAGDEVLRAFAERARASLRDGDAFFRLGGEEFALLLPCTGVPGALAAAERLLSGLREAPVAFGGALIPVTASAGVTCLEPSDAGAESLLARADAALYVAKRSGRDRAEASLSAAGTGVASPSVVTPSRPAVSLAESS